MIELPQRFKNDTQGKNTYLVPLVVINGSIYLSTGKVTLDNQHYDPLLKSLGKIKESIDIFEKKFKVSSVNMDFFNSEYNNEKLMDRFFAGEIINASVDVYYKSQSAVSLNDCIKVFTGYVKKITEKSDLVLLEVEDRTEQVLGKKVPYNFTKTTELPEEQRNKPIPIVYGQVDRCPLVYLDNDNEDNANTYKLSADDFDISTIENLKVFTSDAYLSVPQESNLKDHNVVSGIVELERALNEQQYTIENNSFIIKKSTTTASEFIDEGTSEETNSTVGNLASYNLVEVLESFTPRYTDGEYKYYNYEGQESGVIDLFEHRLIPTTDSNGDYVKDGTFPFYIKVKDFNDNEAPYQMTACTNAFEITGTEFHDYSDEYIRGYNDYNFEVDNFCSGSDVLKEFNNLPIQAVSYIDYNFHIKYNGTYKGTDLWISPIFHFNFGSATTASECPKLFSFSALGDDPQHNFQALQQVEGTGTENDDITYIPNEIEFSGTNSGDYPFTIPSELNQFQFAIPAKTTNIENPKFSINTDPQHTHGFITEAFGAGYVEFVGFKSLTLWKNAILQNFNDFDLYANVTGRVDNDTLRYTSTTELQTFSGMQEGFQQPKQQYQVAPTTQARTSRPSTTAKIPAKQRKRPTRGGRGGGY